MTDSLHKHPSHWHCVYNHSKFMCTYPILKLVALHCRLIINSFKLSVCKCHNQITTLLLQQHKMPTLAQAMVPFTVARREAMAVKTNSMYLTRPVITPTKLLTLCTGYIFLSFIASAKPQVWSKLLYLYCSASSPSLTMQYSSGKGFSSNQFCSISLVPSAYLFCKRCSHTLPLVPCCLIPQQSTVL